VNAQANPGSAELPERLVADLGAAFQQAAVYAPGHPQVKGALTRVLSAFAAWCARSGATEVSLIILEGQLLVDRQAVPEDAAWARGVLRALHRHGVRGLTMVAGLDAEELGLFFDRCQGAKGPESSRHILLGQAGLAGGDPGENAGGAGPGLDGAPTSLSSEHVEGARTELLAVGAGTATRIDRLRGLVAWLARSAEGGAIGALRLTAARVNDREFLHGLAVALTTLRLGRALGVEGNALEALALSGLLHDVGYLEAARPGEGPAERRSAHAVRGAARLAAVEGIPDVAVLVACEHHLRFDEAPNYPAMTVPRQPIAAARVVAVADTWETIRSHGGVDPAEAFAILSSRAGTFLDPALVEVFSSLAMPPAPSPS